MVEVELKPLLKRLNRYATQVLEGAAGLCISRGHYEVTVEHMLLKMCDDPGADLPMILNHFDAELPRVQRSLQRAVEDLRSGNAGKPVFSPILVQWIQDAWVLSSIEFSLDQIRSGALVAVAVAQKGRFLSSDHPELEKVRADELRRDFMHIVAGSSEEARTRGQNPRLTESPRDRHGSWVPRGGRGFLHRSGACPRGRSRQLHGTASTDGRRSARARDGVRRCTLRRARPRGHPSRPQTREHHADS